MEAELLLDQLKHLDSCLHQCVSYRRYVINAFWRDFTCLDTPTTMQVYIPVLSMKLNDAGVLGTLASVAASILKT